VYGILKNKFLDELVIPKREVGLSKKINIETSPGRVKNWLRREFWLFQKSRKSKNEPTNWPIATKNLPFKNGEKKKKSGRNWGLGQHKSWPFKIWRSKRGPTELALPKKSLLSKNVEEAKKEADELDQLPTGELSFQK